MNHQTDIKSNLDRVNGFVEFARENIERSIPHCFQDQVAKHPDRLALQTRELQLTYGALNKLSNRLAHALLARRGAVAEPVALLLEQGVMPVAAIMGVLKAGKFYVPLDPAYPRARSAYILADSTAGVMVTNNKNLALARELAGDKITLVNVDALETGLSTENPDLAISPDHLAYIMYTSGSTGQPKGVTENHRNVLHHMLRITQAFHICKEDRQTLLRSYSFNGSVRDIFGTLLNGASLHPFNVENEGVEKLASWLIDERITTYRSVISLFRHFVNTLSGHEQFPDLRLIHVGGESINKHDVELFQKFFSERVIFVNGLGITETGTVARFYINKRSNLEDNFVPVGYPVDDMEILLLDNHDQPVSANQVGEIAIRSRYLSPGYWQKPHLTQAKFKPDPGDSRKRIYLTGDLGRRLPDGCLVHLGRKDFQVKIRGQRVEIAEIEASLLALDTIKETVVIAQEDSSGSQRLIAYLVPAAWPAPTITALREALGETLPGYMIPAVFMMLESLPLLPTGKLDRRALPAPDRARPGLETGYVAPRTSTEQTLAEIWAEVLKIDRIGIDDHFLELGGHSLMAAQIMARVCQRFEIEISSSRIFENPTIARLAQTIEQLRGDEVEQQISTIRPVSRRDYRISRSQKYE